MTALKPEMEAGMSGNKTIVIETRSDRGTKQWTQIQPMDEFEVEQHLVGSDRFFQTRDKFDPQTPEYSQGTHRLLQRLFQRPSVMTVSYQPGTASGFSVYLYAWASERDQAEIINILIENLGWDELIVEIQMGMGPPTEFVGYTPLMGPSMPRKSWVSMKRLLR